MRGEDNDGEGDVEGGASRSVVAKTSRRRSTCRRRGAAQAGVPVTPQATPATQSKEMRKSVLSKPMSMMRESTAVGDGDANPITDREKENNSSNQSGRRHGAGPWADDGVARIRQSDGGATRIGRSDGHRRRGPVQASSTTTKGAATTTVARCIGGEECSRHHDGCAEGRAQPAA